ncbi:MAG: ABC transporter permease [Actinomycetes bacterium]
MSFVWLIAHNVWTKKVRSLLMALAVAVGVLTVVALGIVTQSIRTTAAGVLRVGAADFTVAQQGVNDLLESSLTDRQLRAVQQLPGVQSAVGALIQTDRLDADHPLVVEIGIRPQDLRPFGVRVAAGRAFRPTAADEVMLGIRLAQELNVRPGDTIDVAGGPKTIVGVYNTANVFGDTAMMFPLVPFQAFQRQPGGLSLLFVKKSPGVSTPALQRAVEASSPLLVAIRNLVEYGRADRSYQLITGADRAATIVAIGVGAIVVMNAMLLSLVERYREFGVLRAIGWSRRRLVALVTGEAGIIAIVGAALGVGLAFGVVQLLARLPALLGILHPIYEPWVFGRALLTALAVTSLGALYPSLRASQLSPVAAMRHE